MEMNRIQTAYSLMVRLTLPLALLIGGSLPPMPIGLSFQESPAKLRPRRDPQGFWLRAQNALEEKEYAEALELILQANAVDPKPGNTLIQAQALVGLGRLEEAYGLFDRTLDLEAHPETQYEVPVLIAYGDAARGTGKLERAKLLYTLVLGQLARGHNRGNPDGKFTAIDPKSSRDAHWLQAAGLAIEIYRPHTVPGSAVQTTSIEAWVAKLREIDRLAPNWDRVWPLLLWQVETSNPQMKAFATAKLTRLSNSSDPALRRQVLMLRKYALGERDLKL